MHVKPTQFIVFCAQSPASLKTNTKNSKIYPSSLFHSQGQIDLSRDLNSTPLEIIILWGRERLPSAFLCRQGVS